MYMMKCCCCCRHHKSKNGVGLSSSVLHDYELMEDFDNSEDDYEQQRHQTHYFSNDEEEDYYYNEKNGNNSDITTEMDENDCIECCCFPCRTAYWLEVDDADGTTPLYRMCCYPCWKWKSRRTH